MKLRIVGRWGWIWEAAEEVEGGYNQNTLYELFKELIKYYVRITFSFICDPIKGF